MRKGMLLEHPVEEYALRIQRLTKEMQKQNLDAILVTAPDNMRYFCGQRSIVWDSNVSMPGVLVITSSGDMSIAGSQSNHGTAVATSCVDEDQFVPFSNGGHPAKNQPMSFPEAVLRVFANLKLEKARIGMEYGKGWIGHSLGLNVHEYPCLETGVDTILKAGMVMTIEPCLHDPQLGMFDLEQNFIVTENGYELLSQAPTELRRII